MQENLKGKRLVIVDDEPAILNLLTTFFKGAARVQTFGSGAAALAEGGNLSGTDLFILDYVLPNMNGGELMRELRKICPQAHFIAITGHFNREAIQDCGPTGWDAMVLKPFDLTMLKDNIEAIFKSNATA